MKKKLKSKAGFTLAEVLTVVGIIGIISALIYPPLKRNFEETQLTAKYKSDFAMLKDVTNKMAYDNGGTLAGLFTNANTLKNYFANYLSTTKNCDNGTTNGKCFAATTYQMDSTTRSYNDAGLILTNGASLNFSANSTPCTNVVTHTIPRCGYVIIDVNGLNPPNKAGQDTFAIHIVKDGLVPYGSHGDAWAMSDCTTYGWGCSTDKLYK